jgi:uncharacterized cupredoxin-like copper-binding protein
MSLGRQVLVGSVAVWLGAVVASSGLAGASPRPALPPAPAADVAVGTGTGAVTVVLDIEHSRFLPERVGVAAGTEVTFVLRNGDPIGHELIVGDDALHELHESGTHASHGARSGEVSVAPGAEARTTVSFDEEGRVRFACHLPGHVAYGMEGEVVVGPAGEAPEA